MNRCHPANMKRQLWFIVSQNVEGIRKSDEKHEHQISWLKMWQVWVKKMELKCAYSSLSYTWIIRCMLLYLLSKPLFMTIFSFIFLYLVNEADCVLVFHGNATSVTLFRLCWQIESSFTMARGTQVWCVQLLMCAHLEHGAEPRHWCSLGDLLRKKRLSI